MGILFRFWEKISRFIKKKIEISEFKDPLTFIDFWILSKFNILPTDIKFQSLYLEQKIALFEGVNNLPDHKEISKHLKITKALDRIKKKKPNELVSLGLIKNMRNAFKQQGMQDEEIERRIKEHCERMKKLEIKSLEKSLNGWWTKI